MYFGDDCEPQFSNDDELIGRRGQWQCHEFIFNSYYYSFIYCIPINIFYSFVTVCFHDTD